MSQRFQFPGVATISEMPFRPSCYNPHLIQPSIATSKLSPNLFSQPSTNCNALHAPAVLLQPHLLQPPINSALPFSPYHPTAPPATASSRSVTVSGYGGLVQCSKLACKAGGIVTITAFGGLPAFATNKSYAQRGTVGEGGGFVSTHNSLSLHGVREYVRCSKPLAASNAATATATPLRTSAAASIT
jgi:hypothetical protein